MKKKENSQGGWGRAMSMDKWTVESLCSQFLHSKNSCVTQCQTTQRIVFRFLLVLVWIQTHPAPTVMQLLTLLEELERLDCESHSALCLKALIREKPLKSKWKQGSVCQRVCHHWAVHRLTAGERRSSNKPIIPSDSHHALYLDVCA